MIHNISPSDLEVVFSFRCDGTCTTFEVEPSRMCLKPGDREVCSHQGCVLSQEVGRYVAIKDVSQARR